MKYVISCLLMVLIVQVSAQYKNDNVLYKTVFPQDLLSQLKANPGYLLLDVRSKGEYSDTSSMSASMNIGHLNSAININVGDLGSRLKEIQAFKNKPVFVYCSHSQRSRRASKMLADSGFTKVFNINGGMTTLFQTPGALTGVYETKNKYTLLSPSEFCIQVNNKNVFLLDVRSDSAFRSISSEDKNALGKIKNSHNIPLGQLEASLGSLPHDKKIVVIDDYGDQGADAAAMLISKGFQNVAVLFDGLLNFVSANSVEVSCKNSVWEHNNKFQLITAEELHQLLEGNPAIAILDVRTPEEFANKSKDYWRNCGHIQNALNISASDLSKRYDELDAFKIKPIVIYSFSFDKAGFNAASTLVSNGFSNVYLLSGGLFRIRWKAANIKGNSALKDLVTDIPPDNL